MSHLKELLYRIFNQKTQGVRKIIFSHFLLLPYLFLLINESSVTIVKYLLAVGRKPAWVVGKMKKQ